MVWIALSLIGLSAVLLFYGAVKLQRLEDRYNLVNDNSVTMLDEEEDNADGYEVDSIE